MIIDCIADWAREVYYPVLVRQLKSITTGISFDLVSVSNDSEVQSRRQQIATWIPAPPTNVGDLEPLFAFEALEAQSVPDTALGISIPNTKRGTVRSAADFESRVSGLRLTEDNCQRVFDFESGLLREGEKSVKAARDLINFVAKWDEVIQVSEQDLDFLEDLWTGDAYAQNRAQVASSATKFYVLLEFSSFMTLQWTIVKKITYFAISDAALPLVFGRAHFQRPPEKIESIRAKARLCPHEVWRQMLECLRLGSPLQHFSSAASCSLLTIYPLPERGGSDHISRTEAFGFGHLHASRLQEIVGRFHKYGQTKLAPRKALRPWGASDEQWDRNVEGHSRKQDIKPTPHELTFVRNLHRRQISSVDQRHDEKHCERCTFVSRRFALTLRLWQLSCEDVPAYGFLLTEALDLAIKAPVSHDFCLFAINPLADIQDNKGLAVVIEDLLQSSHGICHTIRYPIPYTFTYKARAKDEEVFWNLPLPCRPVTKKQRFNCIKWTLERSDMPIEGPAVASIQKTVYDCWEHLQYLMHCLKRHGMGYQVAATKVLNWYDHDRQEQHSSRFGSNFYGTDNWPKATVKGKSPVLTVSRPWAIEKLHIRGNSTSETSLL
jgi:hypothetical protein